MLVGLNTGVYPVFTKVLVGDVLDPHHRLLYLTLNPFLYLRLFPWSSLGLHPGISENVYTMSPVELCAVCMRESLTDSGPCCSLCVRCVRLHNYKVVGAAIDLC